MPATITLSKLSWSTPDGQPLFSNLDLSFSDGKTAIVGRNGVGKTTLFRLIAGELTPRTGSISVNGTVGTLRQAVQVDPDETISSLFRIEHQLSLLARAEAGTASAEDLAEIDWSLESRLEQALRDVRLNADKTTRLAELSGGQRTRAALAALVFTNPDFLLLDEPTNNLDRDGRDAVADLIDRWRGGAVIVSHDRELLERMDTIVELTSLGATRYGGNWSHYRERKALELASAQHDLADAEKRLSEVSRSVQTTAERKARKDGAGKRKGERGDMPKILLGGLKRKAEATSGDNARLAERLKGEAEADLAEARKRIEILQPFAVTLPSVDLPPSRKILRLDRVTAGYDPVAPVIRDLSMEIVGPERVALSGANGSGKTTLLKLITGQLAPLSGDLRVMVDFAMLDQTVSILDPELSIRDNYLKLNPGAGENACRAALARFMFRADAALQVVSTLSGGQLLRAGLACVLGGASPPHLLILDEPTNHLDIDSIATVEAGLSAYDGALLVVSHDRAFLEAIGVGREIELKAC
ncbi:ABC-F family ATP-binding cassette domain-containing protein [Rhizobium sp.]